MLSSTIKGFAIACLFFILSVSYAASAYWQDFRVTEAVLKADNAQLSGPCPIKVVFNGYITANGPGTVKYTFTRSDGARGPAYAIEFKEAGTQAVSTDWTLGDASALPVYEGWQALMILSPNEMESSQKTGSFSITCGQQKPTGKPDTAKPPSTNPNEQQKPIEKPDTPGQPAVTLPDDQKKPAGILDILKRLPFPAPDPNGRPAPTPAGQPGPLQNCRLYGERGTASDGTLGVSACCTSDPSITSVAGGFCEGISPDLPAPGSMLPGSNSRLGSETTIAFVPAWTDAAGSHEARLVMGFNGNTLLNWAISTDQGRTWRDRNRNNGGPGGGPVTNSTPFNSYRGDLSVVALPGIPGGVAMVSLADTPCTPSPVAPCPAMPDLIVLLISTDGGETFASTFVVNDRLGVGTTDQPRVTVDPVDGTIWVLWRGRLALTPFYTYVRGGHVSANGSVRWDINGDGQLVFTNALNPNVDYQHPRFKVFTRPGATSHTVAIAGPQAGPGTNFFAQGRCIPASNGLLRNSFWQYPLGVFFTVSDDDGRHWTDIHSAVDMGQPFGLGCVGGAGGGNATGLLIYSENRIDLARDSHNNNYLVTRARAVSDPATNFFIGQQVEVWRRSISPNSPFALVAVAPWSRANPWQFNPSIAARDDGQIAVSYYQTVGGSQTVELMIMGSRDGGNTWSAPVQLSRNSPQIAADRSLGEYDEIVAVPTSVRTPRIQSTNLQFWPGAFYASWSNGRGRVFAAGFTPPER